MNIFSKIGKDLTLSQEIEKKIEKAIINNSISPGEKLPTEAEMCEMFAVSRTSLREALQKLRARKLIKVKKGSGIYVEDLDPSYVVNSMGIFLERNLDKDYITHIIEVRKIIEPKIAKLAARHRTVENLNLLKEYLHDLEICSIKDYQKQGNIDRDFHLQISKSTSNPMIPIIVEPIFNVMPKIRMIVYAKIEHAHNTALKFHKKIVELIELQNEEGAYSTMKEHLQIAEEHSRIISEVL